MTRPIPIEELLEHAAWLRRLAASLVADPARADDLVQETWLAALRRPPAEDVAPRSWLARVVRNMAHNRARGELRRGEREERRDTEDRSRAPDAIAAEAEAQRLLAEAVVELDEPLRAVVVLRYFRGLDSNAAARELGVPAATVRWRTSKALEELRGRLDRRFGGEREAWVLVLMPMVGRDFVPVPIGVGSVLTNSPGILVIALLGVLTLAALGRVWFGGISPAAGPLSIAAGLLAEAEIVRPSAPADAEHGSAAREAVQDPVPEAPAASAEARVEISGVVLVDGKAPRLPLVLELRTARAPKPAVDARALPAAPVAAEVARSWHAQLERDGSFRFVGLTEGFRGRLRAEGYIIEEPGLALVTAPATGLVLRLRREPALAGRLLDAQGPAPGFDGLVRYEIESEAPGGAGDVSALMPFQTDEEGYFRIPLEGAKEDTTARASLVVESERGRVTLDTARFDPLVGLDLGDVVLEPVRTLHVRVRDALGAPIPGAVARVVGSIPCSRASEPTDGNGECGLGFAPAGAMRLRVDALRSRTRFLEVGQEQTVDVVLEPVAGLELHLSANDPALLLSAKVLLRGPEGPFPAAPGMDGAKHRVDLELESYLREELGATPMHRSHGGPPGQPTSTWLRPSDGRVVIPGLATGIPFELEVQARDGRVLATRTLLLGPHEWLELELSIDP